MPSSSERPKLPSIERLKELYQDVSDALEEQHGESLFEEYQVILEWLITELENRKLRYTKSWMRQKLLTRVGRERLSQDELRAIDRQAEELALKLQEANDGSTTSETASEGGEADQGDSIEDVPIETDRDMY